MTTNRRPCREDEMNCESCGDPRNDTTVVDLPLPLVRVDGVTFFIIDGVTPHEGEYEYDQMNICAKCRNDGDDPNPEYNGTYDDDRPARRLSRHERMQGIVDMGYDTFDEYNDYTGRDEF